MERGWAGGRKGGGREGGRIRRNHPFFPIHFSSSVDIHFIFNLAIEKERK